MMTNEVSIVMPVYNCTCVQLVAELARQCRNIEGLHYEIIAADDGSSDTDCIKENRAINDIEFCSYVERGFNSGRSAIRNFLVTRARYDFLIFLDSDIRTDSEDFILAYLNAGCEGIVYGGVHNSSKAYDEHNLRCVYEHKFEHDNPAAVRNTKPYQQFRTTNFMARRCVMAEHPFDESFKEYGYEDVLFGKAMKDAGIPMLHIDNPVAVDDYDANEEFLDKTRQALRSLYLHRTEMKGYSSVLSAAQRIHGMHLYPFFSRIYRMHGAALERKLCGKKPSLFFFNLYRLIYFISLGSL